VTTIIIDDLPTADLLGMDFSTLGKVQLVQAHNRLASMDGSTANPVKAFRDRASGERRCRELATQVKGHAVKNDSNPATHPEGGKPADDGKAAAEAEKKAQADAAAAEKKAAAEAAKANRPPTLHQLTEVFNGHFAEAKKLKGFEEAHPWAKHHSSDFADRAGAEKQTKRLLDAVEAHKNPPAQKAA
jgi:hypothetical protein